MNSLKSARVEPRVTSEWVVFSSRFRIASVAHAFLITWRGGGEGERESGGGGRMEEQKGGMG